MNEPPVNFASRLRVRERVVVQVDSPAARWIGALAVLSLFCWLIVLLARDHDRDWQAAGRLAWSLTILTAVALIARGIFLGRPVTAAHAWLALVAVLAGLGAHVLVFDLLGNLLIASAGAVLMWSTTARPNPADLPRIWALVNATESDPLAPFAMQDLKCFHFAADRTATIAYRTRMGYAVVSGDPIGDETRFAELVADFAAMCHTRGWRLVVLGCSQRRLDLWADATVLGQTLQAVPIGRDVVIDVTTFDMVGRKYRNLRQAVQRTQNFGITTEVVSEQGLEGPLLAELTEVLLASASGARTERGFSMCLDGALEGSYPGVQLIVARDKLGRVQGFHRYVTAGHGSEVSLDVPWRRRGAPNGIDERLSVDMIAWARDHGAQRLSLAFAAFPEIFNDKNRGRISSLLYTAIHLGDALIALESLYRYLRKFHALGDRRYVMASLTQVLPLLVVLLSLEFMPRRRHLG
ncbi:MAG TPA: phosphatidylglycerol lysyltransferase domain-containing protein [Mycobacterium sp.]